MQTNLKIYFPSSLRLQYYLKSTNNLNTDDIDKEISRGEKKFLSENRDIWRVKGGLKCK